jgi:hypothetical protein
VKNANNKVPPSSPEKQHPNSKDQPNQAKMSDEGSRGRGDFVAFVPFPLRIASRPEWDNFPRNVLFMKSKVESGKLVRGSALYNPDFDTYRTDGDLSSMRYNNAYGGDCYLMMSYDKKNKIRRGEKFVNGKSAWVTHGGEDWKGFFTHLTMLGLADGENCRFERTDNQAPGPAHNA